MNSEPGAARAFICVSTPFDVTPETMLRYYRPTEKKRTADEVLGELAADLLPKANGAAPGKGASDDANGGRC